MPLDAEFKDLSKNGRLEKLVLPASTCDEAKAFLDLSGLDAFSFYPDLAGLAMRHKAETEQRITQAKRLYPSLFARKEDQ